MPADAGAGPPPEPLWAMNVLRLAAFVACALMGVMSFVEVDPPSEAALPAAARAALLLAFGALLWGSIRRIEIGAPTRGRIALLLLQAPLALLIGQGNLFLILALEVPLILRARAAAIWMAAQLVGLPALWLAYATENDVPRGLAHLPHPMGLGLLILEWEGLTVLCFAVAYLAAAQFRGAQHLARNHRELARLNAELLATRQLLADSSRLAERLHISRELHDAAGHHLAALSLNLELASLRAEGAAGEPIREAHAVARLLLADVRNMVSSLRADRSLDLLQAIETLVAGASEPRVHLSLPERLENVEPGQAHVLFRCVQEALTNVSRHAGARNVWVELTQDEQRLAVCIRDDGRGAMGPRPGNGLTGMRERLEEIGGRVDLDAAPGGGFRVRAWVPRSLEES